MFNLVDCAEFEYRVVTAYLFLISIFLFVVFIVNCIGGTSLLILSVFLKFVCILCFKKHLS